MTSQLWTPLKSSPLPHITRACVVYTKRRYNVPAADGTTINPIGVRQLGLMLREISCCAPAGRHTWMESVSSASIPSWDPSPAGFVLRLISTQQSTNPSRCIKTEEDLGSGVVRIRPKNDGDSHKRGPNGARHKKTDRCPSGS